MATALSHKQKMYLTTAGVLAFGVAAYGLGRVYPPLGPSAGTIAPAQRYVSSQVSEGDVTLGDTSVPELMQTDAFQVMVKDANFRQLAQDPGSLVFLRLGELLRRKGQLDHGLRVAIAGLERHPHNADAHDLYARLLADKHDFERAFDEWDMALRIAPNHTGALKGLARTWADPGKFLYDAAKGLWAHHDKLGPNVV